ncbi:hypothetical protein F4778DRAFT_774272 [Xylariomycetidae sp. FL2044]|nr:hypothetical protein F4778DRAFT_774272 [Xylariomycetidae sp. FL2044]
MESEYPVRADLRKDVYRPVPKVAPGTVDPTTLTGDAPVHVAQSVLEALNLALESKDVEKLAGLFYEEQAYWNDMMFIDCAISFQTKSPALQCAGKLVLLPSRASGALSWKIWVLSTWVEQMVGHPENEKLLSLPGRDLSAIDTIETEVFIVGAGSSGLTTAARLKALGVESIIAERNAHVGENWGCRYDCLSFHVPASNCEMPYTRFRSELQTPHKLTKYDVAEHLEQCVKQFHLNVILSATIQSTTYDLAKKRWTVKLGIANGSRTITVLSKHFVQATGFGSGKPYLPSIRDEKLYKGMSIHSVKFSNAKDLVKKGVKSVAVIGSANTAFDILQDCYDAGLQTTMVARSPTYVFPHDYVMDPHGMGAYDRMPLEAADKMLNTMPQALSDQVSRRLFAHLASQEPNRYKALAETGFPVLDSLDPSVDVQHHLVERYGGHYVDMGSTKLISEGKVAVHGRVEPESFTEYGLRLSDGTRLNVDAVVWCTGFADKDARATARSMLGEDDHEPRTGDVPGPEDIAKRLDATFGVDKEGEVRGLAKRQLRMENYWWSRPMVQQIKLALDGVLPAAYRDTPDSN